MFLSFILGNDFVQHTPSINIRYNGLEDLLDVYKKLQIHNVRKTTNQAPIISAENID